MKGSGIIKLGYRPEEAAECLGSKQLVDECVAAGWLKPKVQRHKMVIFDFADISKCWERIKGGDLPPAVDRHPRKFKAKAGSLSHSEGGAR